MNLPRVNILDNSIKKTFAVSCYDNTMYLNFNQWKKSNKFKCILFLLPKNMLINWANKIDNKNVDKS